MKKITLLSLLLCMALLASAQKQTIVQGKVEKKRNSIVKIFEARNGEAVQVASAPIQDDGTFCVKFTPEKEGFYAIADFRIEHTIYVKGGEEINIDLLEKKAVLAGENTPENRALYQWEDFSAEIRFHSTAPMVMHWSYKTFFPEFEKFLTKIDSVKNAISPVNKKFDALLREKIDYDVDYYAMQFLSMPNTVHPTRNDWPPYYDTLVSDDKMTSEDILQLPYGLRAIMAYANFASRIEVPRQGIDALNNPVLQGEVALWYLAQARLRADFDNYMTEFGKYLANDDQKARAQAIGDRLGESWKGKPWIDFTCPDVNGKMVSLSDFKGKIVLVDVWATWCGPCKAEIPYLKQLEEEMKGTDVVFIGVSVDKAEDKQKWIDFVKKENLPGIQIHSADWGVMKTGYNIQSIPRFMLFDREGNFISDSAPRPSSPQLKKILENELNK